jgi:hypothetical protein
VSARRLRLRRSIVPAFSAPDDIGRRALGMAKGDAFDAIKKEASRVNFG